MTHFDARSYVVSTYNSLTTCATYDARNRSRPDAACRPHSYTLRNRASDVRVTCVGATPSPRFEKNVADVASQKTHGQKAPTRVITRRDDFAAEGLVRRRNRLSPAKSLAGKTVPRRHNSTRIREAVLPLPEPSPERQTVLSAGPTLTNAATSEVPRPCSADYPRRSLAGDALHSADYRHSPMQSYSAAVLR
ncbi:hypothetical protein Bbelb_042560 [Branchiostoma belcheri]|nr:hypothetical protein Bbelb_042560 [Branchiostoma belcheri]